MLRLLVLCQADKQGLGAAGILELLVGEEDGTVIYYPRDELTWLDVRSNQRPNRQL